MADFVGPLERLNAVVNDSPTITGTAATANLPVVHRAVAFDASGNMILGTSTAPKKVVGLALSTTSNPVAPGGQVHVVIRGIGLMEAGGAVVKGSLVTVNATGQAVEADSGDYCIGLALTGAAAAGEVIQVHITFAGDF